MCCNLGSCAQLTRTPWIGSFQFCSSRTVQRGVFLYQYFTQLSKHNITQTFRTQGSRGPDQDAARFFSSSPIPQLAAPAPFDLSSLHHTLPGAYSQTSAPQNPALASWASDFVMQQQSPGPQNISPKAEAQYERERSMDAQMASAGPMPQGVFDRSV
jgi:hypothetical protein